MSIPIPRVVKNKMAIDNGFFQKLESQFPGAGRGVWYVYAGLVFQTNDRMDLIESLWKYVKSASFDKELIGKARKLREALLKASSLVGFPKVRTWFSQSIECCTYHERAGYQRMHCTA